MANTTIKISQLANIGNNLDQSTLLPVVDTNGTLSTEKVSVGDLGNFILEEAGNLLTECFVSSIAYSVSNADQPNITSLGNLTGLRVTNLTNVHIPGGNNGYFLQTNGNGNLNWSAAPGAGNGSPGGANRQIQFNNNGLFGGSTSLIFDTGNARLTAANITAANISVLSNLVSSNIATNNLQANNFSISSLNAVTVNASGNITASNLSANICNANFFIGNGSQLTGITATANGAGPNTSIQFNDDGIFSGSANLTFDNANSILNTVNLTVTNVDVATRIGLNTAGNMFETGNIFVIQTNPTHVFEIALNDGAVDFIWRYDQDGHFTFPGNAYLRGDTDLIQMYNNANSQSGVSIFDDFEISAVANVQIFTNNGPSPNIWTFGPDGNLTIPGNIIPDANITYDLGTSSNRFKDIWLANSTIYLGDANITANGNSIVVDSITVTGGNIGNIGNIASINLDGNVNTYLRGDGTWDASASGYSGYSGVSGYSGQVGLSGLSGFSGDNGFSGFSGYSGFSGLVGDSGYSGVSGYSGLSGFSGAGGGLPLANGSSNFDIASTDSNVTITANGTYTWTFDTDGLIVLPGGNTKVGLQYGSEAILTYNNTSFGVATQGNATTFINWSDDVANTSLLSAIYVNDPSGNIGDISLRTGGIGNANVWTFTTDCNLILPNGNSIIQSIANSSLDPTLPNVSTMVLTPDSNYTSQVLVLDPTAPGHIHLRAFASSNIDEPSANIFLGGENTAFEITSGSNNDARIHSNNYTWTFGTDGNLTLPGNISGNTNGFTIGYLDIPQVSASNTTLQLSDAGKHYYSTTVGNLTLTIPNNATTSFATGTAVSVVVQAAGNVLVNAASGVTLYMAGSSMSGNRVVGSYGMATLLKVSTDTWFINGTGVY